VTASHDHAHGHSHDHDGHHGHTHEPEHTTETQPSNLGLGAPVLDIGGDIGALVLYTTEELESLEIEVSLTTDLDHRTHTQIHKRTVNGRTFWAGVYAQLKEGDYQVWWDDASRERTFTITGGAVTELDWR
jgi:hypothetical protein